MNPFARTFYIRHHRNIVRTAVIAVGASAILLLMSGVAGAQVPSAASDSAATINSHHAVVDPQVQPVSIVRLPGELAPPAATATTLAIAWPWIVPAPSQKLFEAKWMRLYKLNSPPAAKSASPVHVSIGK
jgi:hypothetical protein